MCFIRDLLSDSLRYSRADLLPCRTEELDSRWEELIVVSILERCNTLRVYNKRILIQVVLKDLVTGLDWNNLCE